MKENQKCPCGTGRQYSECCEPFILGTELPPTAEALMRSRYSAYVKHTIDYIMNTCVSKGKDDIDYKSTRKWSEESEWLGLKIISTEDGGITDTEGTVEFEADYVSNGLKDTHHEKAKFKSDNADSKWLYDEGKIIVRTVIRSTPKTGRNESCPCGSGKKYKHCCYGKN